MLGDGLREPLDGVEAGDAQANVKARVRHQRSSTGSPRAWRPSSIRCRAAMHARVCIKWTSTIATPTVLERYLYDGLPMIVRKDYQITRLCPMRQIFRN